MFENFEQNLHINHFWRLKVSFGGPLLLIFTWKHVLRRSIVWFLCDSWTASRCNILKIGVLRETIKWKSNRRNRILLSMLWKLKSRIGKRKIVREGPENWHCDWLVLPLLLATPIIQISQDQKCRSHKRNRMKIRPFWFLWLRFSWAYDSAYDSYFQFSPRRNRSYEYDLTPSLVKISLNE